MLRLARTCRRVCLIVTLMLRAAYAEAQRRSSYLRTEADVTIRKLPHATRRAKGAETHAVAEKRRHQDMGDRRKAYTTPCACGTRVRLESMLGRSWIVWSLFSAVFAASTALLAKLGVAEVD